MTLALTRGAEGFSGGIWIFWSKSWGSVEVLSSHRQLVHVRVTPRSGQPSFSASFVYGSPNMKTVGFDDCFVVEAEGFSGGIWIFWSKSWGSVEVLSSHRQLVHVRVTPRSGQPSFSASFVYGSPNTSIREFLWRELRRIASQITEPWIVMGDFNSYMNASDKVGGAPPNLLSMSKFRDCIEECSLSDLGFKGPPFTWEGRGVKERIDWSLGNAHWLASFPEASVLHLPKLKSDHKPMLLQLCKPQEDMTIRPFRFLAAWLTHEDFPRLVESSWNNHEAWTPASDKLREEVTSWNKHVFGEIGRKKRQLVKSLEGINNLLRRLQGSKL
ncbi:uncharacterized protein LOC130719379 [Lotus japonicus]|uniref:uncharacterized protein LOC130719379 n=1 Tax=Lotus japonicus TaxID=34305 RepID=UPI002582E609|nr:uncharacterized protein LOC130719379 [Lotus japonicus]